MPGPALTGRPGRTAVTVAAVAAAIIVGAAGPATADPAGTDPTVSDVPKTTSATGLDAHDAELLAAARAKGEQTVTVLFAAERGRTGNVATGLAALGATVANRVDAVGYLRAAVPTSAVPTAARLPGVAAIDLNEAITLPDPGVVGTTTGSTGTTTLPGPGAGTPAANPYLPTAETGAVAFKQEHPTWDGRGVTVGILDSGVDLDSPALQTTTTGERKIVDWITVTDPIQDGDGTWRAMLTAATGPTATYAGATWTLPAGSYLINRFTESITAGGDEAGDVNRDGDTTDVFGVLYDPVSHDVRVDTNQNRDFTDDAVLRPYRERFDVGHFGVDNPQTAVREQVPFVIEYREDVDTTPAGRPGTADYVNIGIVESSHGTHVAGITAGNDLFGNAALDGAAPGAKLVSARACSWTGGCTAAALTDGLVELVVNRGVDVVNISIGGLPGLNDGNNARAELYNRLINDYKVQLFVSAGNSGPGTNTVGDPSVATDAVSVAASVSRETWLANYGSVVQRRMSLFNFSSRGPREDGGFKPNISAPGSAISTTPLWQTGSAPAEAGYQLPPGYSMFNGTSMAAPQATGAAALLLSAAKATGTALDPATLRGAVYSSADWIDGVSAAEQGTGLFDVVGAWRLIGKGVKVRGYTSDAPVCTPLSGYLATPGRGTGIYNRCAVGQGGQRPGESRTYTVKITRTSGPNRGITHAVSWLGNDGTFNTLRNVVVPLNKTISISVQAKPSTGAHSAILRIDDPATPNVDFAVLNTVVAAPPLTEPEYTTTARDSVQRNGYRSVFVSVPAGGGALRVDLSGVATGSQTRWIAINPNGVPVESTSSLVCFTNFSDPASCNQTTRTYLNPQPGVWEFEVESRRTSPLLDNPFQLTTRVLGVAVDPATVTIPTATPGVAIGVQWTLTNAFGPVSVAGVGGPLGSALGTRPTIAAGGQSTFEVAVPAGATRVEFAIDNPSDPGADLDLYVYLGDTLVGQAADGDSDEAVTIAAPAAGTYRVVVDGYAVPAGTTEFDYRDAFYATSLGSTAASGDPVSLAGGGSATITGSVVVAGPAAAGRQLVGGVDIVADGTVLGRGEVVIGSLG